MDPSRRGHWNRALSRAERTASGRRAILDAAMRAVATHGPNTTVAHVVALAGVGRNTFYELFPDLGAALAAAEDAAAERFTEALSRHFFGAHTPRERLRAVARAWVESGTEPTALPLGSPFHQRRAGRLERALRDVLAEARGAGVIGREPDRVRVRCLMGAFVAAELDGGTANPESRAELPEMLLDLALRVFR